MISNKWILPLLILALSFSSDAAKKAPKKNAKKTQASEEKDLLPADVESSAFSKAKKALWAEKPAEASILFKESIKDFKGTAKAEPQFMLGNSYYKMGLKVPAAFSLMQVVKNGDTTFRRKALDRLAIIGDALDSDGILNYSLEKIPTGGLPEESQDLIALRFGSFMLDRRDYEQALTYFTYAQKTPRSKLKALYGIGVAASKLKRYQIADEAFKDFYLATAQMPPTDINRGLGIISRARLSYAQQNYEDAAEWYQKVPKDHELWYSTQIELAWSLFRSGQVKSALGPLQTISSNFYENYYNPESLILRGTIYLYLCHGEEADQVVKVFRNEYQKLGSKLEEEARSKDHIYHYTKLANAQKAIEAIKVGKLHSFSADLPLHVYRYLISTPVIRRQLSYLKKIETERNTIKSLSKKWKSSSAGKFAMASYKQEIERIKLRIGNDLREQYVKMIDNLNEFVYQADFIAIEALSTMREIEKAKMIVSNKDRVKEIEKKNRTFFVQNGFRIWPFEHEYWKDEVGNFYYFGENNCGKLIK